MPTHSRAIRIASLLIAVLAITAASKADTLYSSGASNGTINGAGIGPGLQVEDSFTLSSASTLTGVTFGNLLARDPVVMNADIGLTIQWTILSTEGGSVAACTGCTGTATLTADGTFPVTFEPGTLAGVNQEFSLPDLTLSAGTYWLELGNEVTHFGPTAAPYWDINGGSSMAWTSWFGDVNGANCVLAALASSGECSNSFTISGTTSDASPTPTPTPEPSSLALLGSGLTLLAAQLRRRRLSRKD